jgi:CPA2 family monovalent cation:H+ antiporter-2
LQDVAGVTLSIIALIALRLQPSSGVTALTLVLLYAIIVVIATGLLPRLLRQLRQEHDLFLIVSVASALALAGVGARFFGIPLALAAFVSGLAISESREASEARERLLPFRDVFAVLFFVAIGALIDPGALLKGLGWLVFLLALLVAAKVLPIYLLSRFGRLPGRPRQIATGLGQIGEFSFVLATIGVTRNVIPGELYAAILAAVVLTIAASTLLVRVGYSRPLGS